MPLLRYKGTPYNLTNGTICLTGVSQFLLIHLQTYRQTYIGVVVVVIRLDVQLPVQTVPITSKVVSSNSVSSI